MEKLQSNNVSVRLSACALNTVAHECLVSKAKWSTLMFCQRHLRGWFNSAFLTFSRWIRANRKFKTQNRPDWLCVAQTSKAEARKSLGHFTVSGQEEQIVSALHDHSRDWPERGLCLPKGRLEWHGLVARGGMWSAVTGTGVAWEAALFPAGLLPLSFQPLPCHAALGAMMSSRAEGSGQLP